MKPRIFASAETQFTGLGLGSLPDAISCKVTEDLCGTDWRGGEYTLEMEYPITGVNYDLIAEERIICVKPSENAASWQPFRIYAITRPIGGVVVVKADHVSRQLTKIVCPEFSLTGEISLAFEHIDNFDMPVNSFTIQKSGNDYISTYGTNVPRTVYDLLCGASDSLLDQYIPTDPECYTFDKWSVTLGARGQDNGVTISYGKNLTDVEKASDMTDTITGYMPYWKNDQDVICRLSSLGTHDDIMYSDNHASYINDMVAPIDVTSVYNDHKTDTASALYTAIQYYVYQQLEPASVLPATISVKFVSLSMTDEYKELMKARTVNLGDFVTVKYAALGINEKQRVIKTVYDVLAERYDSIDIGTKQINLAGVIAKIAKRSR